MKPRRSEEDGFERRRRTFVGKILHVFASSGDEYNPRVDGHFVVMMNYEDLFVYLTPEGRASVIKQSDTESTSSPSDSETAPEHSLESFLSVGRMVRVKGHLQTASTWERLLKCFDCELLPRTKNPPPQHHYHTHDLQDDSEFICEHQRRRMKRRQRHLCSHFQLDPSKPCPIRFCNLRHFYVSDRERHHTERERGHKKAMKEMQRDVNDPWDQRHKKSLHDRHRIMADFVLATFGKRKLQGEDLPCGLGNGVVLDVGGGHGSLSRILWEQYDIKSVIVDPMRVDWEEDSDENSDDEDDQVLMKKPRGQFGRSSQPPIPPYREERYRSLFNSEFVESPDGAELMGRCTLIMGLHADEATEPIAEISAQLNKPVCLVPCCVHSRMPYVQHFSEYCVRLVFLAEGKLVVQEEELDDVPENPEDDSPHHFHDHAPRFEEVDIDRNDRQCRVAFLNMKGRNKVLYVL